MFRVIAAGFALFIIIISAIAVMIGLTIFADKDRDIIERLAALALILIAAILFDIAANTMLRADRLDIEEKLYK